MVEEIKREEFENKLNSDSLLLIKKGNSFNSKKFKICLYLISIFLIVLGTAITLYFYNNSKGVILLNLMIVSLIILIIVFMILSFIFNFRNYSLIVFEDELYYNLNKKYYKINFNEFNKIVFNVSSQYGYDLDDKFNFEYFIKLFNYENKIFVLYFSYYLDYTIFYYVISEILDIKIDLKMGNPDEIKKYIQKKKSKYFTNGRWVIN